MFRAASRSRALLLGLGLLATAASLICPGGTGSADDPGALIAVQENAPVLADANFDQDDAAQRR